ncbi:hypothetical protein RHGRI_038199 [Rhododendron griersonianum]|uniref:Uncharacterized protein n=1 Tax=Rhododendron griersonianum TaxID=479676 RepID=A0AAV6HVC9_9ERIC|nr:hypothetical protein RHGRI_038199 [Rhododendron griersonianum]
MASPVVDTDPAKAIVIPASGKDAGVQLRKQDLSWKDFISSVNHLPGGSKSHTMDPPFSDEMCWLLLIRWHIPSDELVLEKWVYFLKTWELLIDCLLLIMRKYFKGKRHVQRNGMHEIELPLSEFLKLRRHGDIIKRTVGGYFIVQGRADDTMNRASVPVNLQLGQLSKCKELSSFFRLGISATLAVSVRAILGPTYDQKLQEYAAKKQATRILYFSLHWLWTLINKLLGLIGTQKKRDDEYYYSQMASWIRWFHKKQFIKRFKCMWKAHTAAGRDSGRWGMAAERFQAVARDLHGLAGGTAALAFIGMSIAVLPICSGAFIGFLLHKRYKASIFKGDMGSLALGGALSAMAYCTGMFLQLFFHLGSSLLNLFRYNADRQVASAPIYWKIILGFLLQDHQAPTGRRRRLFRMAPFLHCLELCGIKEPIIVAVAFVISSVSALLAGYV